MTESRTPKVVRAKVVQAQRFELVDAKGKRRAKLGPIPSGTPDLRLYDEMGTLRVHLGVTGLSIRDRDGKVVWKAP